MSGHSKWAKIKRQKGANDIKRGALFTKLAKIIAIAASEGGGDPDMNFTLRLAVEKAKQANMPLVNIEKAIKRGTGELDEGTRLEKVIYEAVLSNGGSLIIECTTDNKNRTVADLRRLLENNGGTLGVNGSVSWKYDEVGYIVAEPKKLVKSSIFGKEDTYEPVVDIEALEMELIEIEGIRDIQQEEGNIIVITEKTMYSSVNKTLYSLGLKIQSAEIRFLPKEYISIDEQATTRLLELMSSLDDHDDVENVFTDINLD